jgi:hypothetical protein
MAPKKARVIAFYLPQFHPIVENDEWWGKGFTEWTNVGKAKALFKGHYQPRVPADLGYYDLRMPEVREAQAKMAREAGIEGFCYYHYWFDTNKQLLERPFNEVLKSGKPNFPFMLCWANESWHAKFWNNDGQYDKKLLVEQKYGNTVDQIAHFNYLLNAFKDERYIRIDDKPAFMIYRPLDVPEAVSLINLWQDLAIKNGLKGIHFIGQSTQTEKFSSEIKSLGFESVNSVRHYDILKKRTLIQKFFSRIRHTIKPYPFVFDYQKSIKGMIDIDDSADDIFPTLIPNWDHTPRSGNGGFVLTNSTPAKFGDHIDECLNQITNKDESKKIIFLKSWNEWGEGNYVEPDMKYGNGYLDELKKRFT